MSISEYNQDRISIRGIDVSELIQQHSFTDAICLMWRGNLPDEAERRLLDAMLVSTVIHTETSPSIVAAKNAYEAGTTLEAAVAAGCLTMGPTHGGAVEQFAKILQTEINFDLIPEQSAIQLIESKNTIHQRVPGFGHVLHPRDPRTVCLLSLAKEYGKYGKYCKVAVAIQNELENRIKKPVPLNITGAMAAILSELGFSWQIGTAFFLLSRTVGIVATLQEEMQCKNS